MNVSIRAAFRAITLCSLAMSVALAGCKEEQKPAPAEAPKPHAATPAPKPAEPAAAPAAQPGAQAERAEKECAAPIDVTPPQEVKIGERAATREGYRLTFKDKDADGALTLGVLGPVNEDSGANLLNLKKYLKYFAEQKADAIVVTGDVGETPEGISRVLTTLAESKLPVFVVAGNRECRADYTNGVLAAQKQAPNVVNLNEVRAVVFPEATLVSLPGYHDPTYMGCATGCQYFKSTVDEVVRVAKESRQPVILVSHGPPRGQGSQAPDYATAGGNVGDPEVNRAITEGNIAFGLFSNIKEGGARAVDSADGTTLVKEGKPSKRLFLNPGPADSVGWTMNDETKSVGMAAVMKVTGDQATWSLFRAKPLSGAEKAQAKTLDPKPKAEDAEQGGTPAPPPGQPAGTPEAKTP